MSIDLVLNELSEVPSAPNISLARDRMATFLGAIRRTREYSGSVATRFVADPNNIALCPEYPIARWRNDGDVDRELRRAWNGLAVRYPLLTQEDSERLKEEMALREVLFNDEYAKGMEIALILETLCMSFASDECWNCSRLSPVLREVDENGSLNDRSVSLRHLSKAAHVTDHESWLKDRSQSVRDWEDLWLRRVELFPRLTFCENVRRQLRGFAVGDLVFHPVCRRLFELDAYLASWTSGPFNPTGCGKATCESGATLETYGSERTFICPDGLPRLFSWHVRYTPGAGRIYVFPLDAEKRGLIGYVGRHLPTVNYPG